jgi:hypothetical protein
MKDQSVRRIRLLSISSIALSTLALTPSVAYADGGCEKTTSGATVCYWEGGDCEKITCCVNSGGGAVKECTALNP